ncbi:MAG TPA: polyprenyl diphosphate synthase [Terriglobia bacterium]|nr:polyprenyl diphosphate synthase [Terriglobia bacterium]
MQSPLHQLNSPGIHVAIIMDGNGRWARRRGLLRSQGHRAGVQAVRRVIAGAIRLGVGTLTLHAFSSDNWQRCPEEVASLFGIFEEFLFAEPTLWIERGVRATVIGRRDRMPGTLLQTIEYAESATSGCQRFHLRLAIDYSSRQAILRAARHLNSENLVNAASSNAETEEARFGRLLSQPDGEAVPEVDLLIRTGGEQRLSDFMLWECAYAELFFTPRLWPDFTAEDFESAVKDFHSRDRRFGRIPESVAV